MPSLKQIAIKAMSRLPIYRVIPVGSVRIYAALRYHERNSSRQAITNLVRSMSGITTRYHSTAIIATRAAFRAGQDDLVEDALDRIVSRFPESASARVLRSDVHTFCGHYDQAIASAERAQLLDPSSAPAAARTVRLAYRRRSRGEADQLAVDALRRFPLSADVAWAVAKECTSIEQYDRIRTLWDERAPEPLQLLKVVRQLAMAATRARQLDAAADLYLRAITLLQQDQRTSVRPAVRRLEGRGAWAAINDICDTLDDAGVPFFFAAGTALGLVREGRPLGADNDIDVGVLAQDWERQKLIEHFVRDPRFDLDLHPLSDKVCLRHRGESPVDIFRFYEENGRLWHDGVFVRWHNRPFTVVRRDIGAVSLPLPDDADTYLTENYGQWRTPNSSFDPFTDQAPNVEVTWPEYQRLHLVRRAYKQLTVGDAAAARDSLRAAGASEVVEEIGAGR